MSSMPHSREPAADPGEKLGVAAEYLVNQVTSKKAEAKEPASRTSSDGTAHRDGDR